MSHYWQSSLFWSNCFASFIIKSNDCKWKSNR